MDILVKVGDQPVPGGFKDGDIIQTASDFTIGWTHGQLINHPAKSHFNSDGLRADEHSEKFYEMMVQWKFERVGPTTFHKIDLFNDKTEVHELPHLDAWIRERTSFPRHRFFGTAGAERWYQTPWTLSDAALDSAWQEIEARRGILRADRDWYPYGAVDRCVHLPMKVNGTRKDAKAWERKPEDTPGNRREHFVPWRDIGGIDVDKALTTYVQYDMRTAPIDRTVVGRR